MPVLSIADVERYVSTDNLIVLFNFKLISVDSQIECFRREKVSCVLVKENSIYLKKFADEKLVNFGSFCIFEFPSLL